jgi:hypothetical protein
MKEFPKKDYDKTIIELLNKVLDLHTQCVIFGCFILIQSLLLFFGYIRFDYIYIISVTLSIVKHTYNTAYIKKIETEIEHIENIRDNNNT